MQKQFLSTFANPLREPYFVSTIQTEDIILAPGEIWVS